MIFYYYINWGRDRICADTLLICSQLHYLIMLRSRGPSGNLPHFNGFGDRGSKTVNYGAVAWPGIAPGSSELQSEILTIELPGRGLEWNRTIILTLRELNLEPLED